MRKESLGGNQRLFFGKDYTYTQLSEFEARALWLLKYVDDTNFLYEVCIEISPINYWYLGQEKKTGFHTFLQAWEDHTIPNKGQFKTGCGGKNKMVEPKQV